MSRNRGSSGQYRGPFYEDYWNENDVRRALSSKGANVIQGRMLINNRDNKDSFVVCSERSVSKISTYDLKDRNRALHGDVVVVQLYPRDQWKVKLTDVASLEEDEAMRSLATTLTKTAISAEGCPAQKGEVAEIYTTVENIKRDSRWSPTIKALFSGNQLSEKVKDLVVPSGKVVHISRRNHSRLVAGRLSLSSSRDNRPQVHLLPSDRRVPKVLIPNNQWPQGFANRPESFRYSLYLGRITEWSTIFPKGSIESLGQDGDIEPTTQKMLLEYGIEYEQFSAKVMRELPPKHGYQIPAEELRQRKDCRRTCVFTIDNSSSTDQEDALSCEDLGNDRYEVGVHISDVSCFVQPATELDKAAARRAFSVYLVHKVVPMLPEVLSEQLCVLVPGEDRLAISVFWQMSSEGQVLSERLERTVIRSCAKLNYDDAQAFIDGRQSDPPILNGFRKDDVGMRITTLNMETNCQKMGIQMDASSSLSIQRSLADYERLADDEGKMMVLISQCAITMQGAQYVCVDGIPDTECGHYALGVPCYTHFTSPVRRYVDILVHRMLANLLDDKTLPVLTTEAAREHVDRCNEMSAASKRVEPLSRDLFFFRYLKNHVDGVLEDAVVKHILEDSFYVVLLKSGLETKVQCAKMQLKNFFLNEDADNRRQLRLVWPASKDHRGEVEQIIEVLARVVCLLEAEEEPIRWNAVLLHPSKVPTTR